jgi:hypothetical protein
VGPPVERAGVRVASRRMTQRLARELGEEVACGEGEHEARVGDLPHANGGGVDGVVSGDDGIEGHGRQRGDGEVDRVEGRVSATWPSTPPHVELRVAGHFLGDVSGSL